MKIKYIFQKEIFISKILQLPPYFSLGFNTVTLNVNTIKKLPL